MDGFVAALLAMTAIQSDRQLLQSVLHIRGTKVRVMAAQADVRLSAAPLDDAGFPLLRE